MMPVNKAEVVSNFIFGCLKILLPLSGQRQTENFFVPKTKMKLKIKDKDYMIVPDTNSNHG